SVSFIVTALMLPFVSHVTLALIVVTDCIVIATAGYFLIWNLCIWDPLASIEEAAVAKDRRGLRRPGFLSTFLVDFSKTPYELPPHSWRTILSHVEFACATADYALRMAGTLPSTVFPIG